MSERVKRMAAPAEAVAETVEPIEMVESPAYYEYIWAGTREQVEAFLPTLPKGSAVAPLWEGQPFEHYPSACIVLFRSPEPVRQPEWASRVDPAVARGVVGVFA